MNGAELPRFKFIPPRGSDSRHWREQDTERFLHIWLTYLVAPEVVSEVVTCDKPGTAFQLVSRFQHLVFTTIIHHFCGLGVHACMSSEAGHADAPKKCQVSSSTYASECVRNI